jgi:hypothetical protein
LEEGTVSRPRPPSRRTRKIIELKEEEVASEVFVEESTTKAIKNSREGEASIKACSGPATRSGGT